MNKVILVEDNKIERRNISSALEAIEGCTLCASFFNGLEALEYLKNNEVDIVVTDVQMPEMDGIELVKNIRELDINVEVIIVSGYSDFDNAKNAVGLNVVSYIMKPIIGNEFVDAMFLAMQRCREKNTKKADYEQLKMQVEASKQLLLEQFIRNVIVSDGVDPEYVRKNEELFEINVTDNFKITFIMKIKECHSGSAMMVTYALINYILRRKFKNVSVFPFALNENEVGAVVVSDKREDIISEIISLKNDIVRDYDVTVIVGASSVSRDINAVSRQYGECKRILEEITDIKNVVIVYEDLFENDEEEAIGINKERIRQLILNNNTEEIKNTLSNALSMTDDDIVKKRNFAYGYVNLLEIILSEYGYSFDNILGVREIWKKLADFESIINLTNYLDNLTVSVIELVNSENDESNVAVKKIKEIIKARYSEHITVGHIAEEINFSRKQTHRIFTQSTGMTIFEYLTNYRIEMAKKLLDEGKSVDVVVFEVGYRDRTYFGEIFKEKTGMTPIEYKNR